MYSLTLVRYLNTTQAYFARDNGSYVPNGDMLGSKGRLYQVLNGPAAKKAG